MRLVVLFILLVAAIFILTQPQRQPQTLYNSFGHRILHPFDGRLRYAIGDVDPRFGISEQELIRLSQQAAEIWQQGLGEQLFVYDPDARLKINLIYDQRQAESMARQQAKNDLQQSHQQHIQNQQQIEMQRQQLDHEKQRVDWQIEQLEHQQRQYQQNIQTWNQSDRRNSHARDELQRQQQYLQQQQAQVQYAIDQYQQRLNQFNQQVSQLNQHADRLNHSVSDFNRHFQPRQFDKGVFKGQEIDIYEFQSQDDLRVTIAHELGHALGLKHHHDPKALMYPMLKQQQIENFQLQPADIALFQQR